MVFFSFLSLEFFLMAFITFVCSSHNKNKIVSKRFRSCILVIVASVSIFVSKICMCFLTFDLTMFDFFEMFFIFCACCFFCIKAVELYPQQIKPECIDTLHIDGNSYSIERTFCNLTGHSGYSLYYNNDVYYLGNKIPMKDASRSITLYLYNGRVVDYAYDFHIIHSCSTFLYIICFFLFPLFVMYDFGNLHLELYRLLDIAYLFFGTLSLLMSRFKIRKRFTFLKILIYFFQFFVVLYFFYDVFQLFFNL